MALVRCPCGLPPKKVYVRDMYWNGIWIWVKTCENEGDLFSRRQTLQLEFVGRFSCEQRKLRMVFHGVIVWFLPVFPCLPLFPFLLSCLSCDGFCCLSAFVSFSESCLFFSYLVFPPAALHFRFCQASAFPPVIFFPPASCILHHPFCMFLRRFCFPLWFCVLERSQNEGKNQSQNSRQAAWPGPGRELANIRPRPATTWQLPLLLQGLVMFLLQANSLTV